MTEIRPKSTQSFLTTVYLVAYNFIQCTGWSAMLYVALLHLFDNNTVVGTYKSVEWLLKVFQTAAIVEVVHAAVGFVRSNPVLTGFQVASRVFLTWGIAHSVPTVQDGWGVSMFILAWAITEVIRYAFYALGLLGHVPYPIVWCRYTFFLVLYPLGVTGEIMALVGAMPHVKQTGMYSVRMPNSLNCSFDYHTTLILLLPMYALIFPQLFNHMLKQRKKIIGGGAGGGAHVKAE